jgi:hypothetical protein
VEIGLMKDFDRFSKDAKNSVLNNFLLWPIKFLDRLNEGQNFNKYGVNIIIKADK